MREIVNKLPHYDYIYLGDNARAPYGSRSFETVYRNTLQCVKWFFGQGCPLVVLACNTASAKALRTIQQNDLNGIDPQKRVLGVIRPTTEVIGNYSDSKSIGILATTGTVNSKSYVIEIEKFLGIGEAGVRIGTDIDVVIEHVVERLGVAPRFPRGVEDCLP